MVFQAAIPTAFVSSHEPVGRAEADCVSTGRNDWPGIELHRLEGAPASSTAPIRMIPTPIAPRMVQRPRRDEKKTRGPAGGGVNGPGGAGDPPLMYHRARRSL